MVHQLPKARGLGSFALLHFALRRIEYGLIRQSMRVFGLPLLELSVGMGLVVTGDTKMKRILIAAAILSVSMSSTVYAKGCIKGAIVGGVAGSVAGHGKLGAAAGCVIGHHEANKADATKTAPQTTGQTK